MKGPVVMQWVVLSPSPPRPRVGDQMGEEAGAEEEFAQSQYLWCREVCVRLEKLLNMGDVEWVW